MNDGFNPADGVPAGGILKEAANIVEGARQQTHGPKERSFNVIAQLWMVYLAGRRGQSGCVITGFDVSVMMSLLKIARAIQGTPTRDHFVDLAGYGAIAGEISLSGDAVELDKQMAVAAAIQASNADAGEGKALREMERELRELRAYKADAERRLDMAAQMFDSYAQHHHAKSPPDGIKAQRNASMAAMCRGGPMPLHNGGVVSQSFTITARDLADTPMPTISDQ